MDHGIEIFLENTHSNLTILNDNHIDYMKINDRIISVYFDKHMYNTATIVNDFLIILKNNNIDYLFTNR